MRPRSLILGSGLIVIVLLGAGCGGPVTEGFTRYSNALFTIEVPSEWQVIDGTRLTAAEFEAEMVERTGRPLEEVQQSGAGRLEMFSFLSGETGVAGLWPATLTLERRSLEELADGDQDRLSTAVTARIEALGGEVIASETGLVINDIPAMKLQFAESWIGPEVVVHQYFFLAPTQGWILTLTFSPDSSTLAGAVAQSFRVK